MSDSWQFVVIISTHKDFRVGERTVCEAGRFGARGKAGGGQAAHPLGGARAGKGAAIGSVGTIFFENVR